MSVSFEKPRPGEVPPLSLERIQAVRHGHPANRDALISDAKQEVAGLIDAAHRELAEPLKVTEEERHGQIYVTVSGWLAPVREPPGSSLRPDAVAEFHDAMLDAVSIGKGIPRAVLEGPRTEEERAAFAEYVQAIARRPSGEGAGTS